MSSVRAFIGLGSNVGDRMHRIRDALAALRSSSGVSVVRVSPVYETDPVGPPQPVFLNAVAEIRTSLTPRALLTLLKDAERTLGRTESERWGPREIDLDLLLYGEEIVHEEGLVVPHPEIGKRAFVLVPLNDLVPDAVVPGAGTVGDLLASSGSAGVRSHRRRDLGVYRRA